MDLDPEAGALAANPPAPRSRRGQRIAIVGATGAVGRELIKVLHDRQFALASLRLFASERSVGQFLDTPAGNLPLERFSLPALAGFDIIFLAVSGSFSKEFAPWLAKTGATVIDNSSAFRYDDDVPLLVPEVNGAEAAPGGIIANPNCTTAILCVALNPLLEKFGLRRVIVSTYQAASGAGAAGIAELNAQTRSYLDQGAAKSAVFRHPLPFNVIPHIDTFQDNGYSREEMKVVWESRKILGQPHLAVSCTAVRVPTLRAHAESVTVETERPVTVAAARELLRAAPGVRLIDDPEAGLYPMPLTASGRYEVDVGRIRQSLIFGERGLDLFICGDQLLKGAALNAVQIAELIC